MSVIDAIFDALEWVTYTDLPTTHQLAIAEYMWADSGVWEIPEVPTTAGLLAAMPFYIQKYGRLPFGMAKIPMRVMKKAIFESNGRQFREVFNGDFEQYHAWYMTNMASSTRGPGKKHTVWPVILNPKTQAKQLNGLIQDGAHRFHAYVEWGLRVVPVVAYNQRVQYFEEQS
jgi:hypothetical protein